MKSRIIIIFISSLLLVGCSSISAILTTPTPIPTPTPTKTPEQIYVSQIQPALEGLTTWVDGALAEYEASLNIAVNKKGEIVANPTDNDTYLLVALTVNWQYPDFPLEDEALKKYVAPAADKASQTGFEVMSAFKAVTPPASVKTAHDQIVECVEYKVELTAEISKSIMGTYSVPKSLDEKDPCDLFEASVQNLKNFIETNK